MTPDHLRQLADDPNLIEGIYNYCDRWCERCAFTSRCLNFALLNEGGVPENDVQNAAFWEKFEDTMKLTAQMLQELATDQGVDLDAVSQDEKEEIDAQLGLEEAYARTHWVTKTAEQYSEWVGVWFDSAETAFLRESTQLLAYLLENANRIDPEKLARAIKESIDVISWYRFQIEVKLMRALTGRVREEEYEDDDDFRDSDGSAKVVLIGVDRSLAAWANLAHHVPEQAEDIGEILIHLQRLRQQIEGVFPDARAFFAPRF